MMRLCSGCGTRLPMNQFKCDSCRRTYEREKSRRRRRTAKERTRRQDLIREHVARFGWTCPGWQCPPHPSTDLTADHIHPVARGGAEDGAITVLCRSCNSRRGAGGIANRAIPGHRLPELREINQSARESENEKNPVKPLVA